jgi:hypothetical protein
MSLISNEQLQYPLTGSFSGSFSGSINVNTFQINDVPQFNWGSLNSITTQKISNRNVPQPITYDNLNSNSIGISLANNSEIHILNKGIYNVQFSTQIYSDGGPTESLYIWFAQNGNSIPVSNNKITLTKNQYDVLSWNTFITCHDNDYVEIIISATNENISLTAITGLDGNPDVPSITVTINQVAPHN